MKMQDKAEKQLEKCLKQICSALNYFFSDTPNLYLKIIKQKGKMLRYIPDKYKTDGLCLEAVENSGLVLRFVPDEFKTA